MTRQQNTRAEAPATAVVVFDPVEAGRSLAREVNARKPQLAALLGIEAESERGKAMLDRFVTVALHAATSRPDILRATRESLIESIRDAAMLGLEPVGATGDGSIVVYDEKVKVERPSRSNPNAMIVVEERIPTAHFQPMYRGLLKLARRSGQLAHVDAHVVYEGDNIEIDLGSVPRVSHFPVLDGAKRGGYVGAYAVAELGNGRRYVDWMTTADIELVRRKSRAKDAMAWTDFWPEMARKTVLRRLMKRLPLETLAEHALRIENEAEERAIPPVTVSPVAESSDARRRLRDRFAPPEITAGEEGTADGAADAGSEPYEAAEAGSAAVSVDPSASEPPADAVEGETRADDGLCGAESDSKLGDVETCALERGHLADPKAPRVHRSATGNTFPATKAGAK